MTLFTSDFDYHLPKAAIAQEAIEPRDAARLLVASTLDDLTFTDLPSLLDPGDVIVVNETRVRAARLRAIKPTGGAVELLLIKRRDAATWETLVRPARRIRKGQTMVVGPLSVTVLTEPDRGVVVVEISGDSDVDDLLPTIGEVPLPPYFHGRLDDDERYQTMFSKTVGSAAAPTAALHFTSKVVASLADREVQIVRVDLEVGLDTFRPMNDGPIERHRMHRERYRVPEATATSIADARERGNRVVAIGTTVVRTLESATNEHGGIRPGLGESGLFVKPGYAFRAVDAVVTNFHAPRTTLLVLIAAVLGERWRVVYEHALASGYRFLSFGDAMFLEVPR
ncbi:MAG: tRNA preQ1(34) S-adenosylmethionine ribosyltransferase-isomerase QueA [Acidimicrobiia bacterium]|nr:MAG: tRNA preQ1(34) S-adenosylmethionine ribosyltransferase-isomerase QueA [Acidimicrobiia bacterium]